MPWATPFEGWTTARASGRSCRPSTRKQGQRLLGAGRADSVARPNQLGGRRAGSALPALRSSVTTARGQLAWRRWWWRVVWGGGGCPIKKDAANNFWTRGLCNVDCRLQNSHDCLSAADVVLRAHGLWFRFQPTWDLFGARSSNERVRLSNAAIHCQSNCRPYQI